MDKTFIKTAMSQFNIDLSDEQIDMFNTYYELLVDWNSRMNLTAITEYEDVIIKHFVDSLSIVKYLDTIDITSDKYDTYSPTIIDIGTGAGFPGIPIKILLPSSKVVLVDSLNKRINFLNEVIRVLDLKDITAIHSRAEDFGHGVYREKGDYVVSRAVANISTLSEYCLPLVKQGGVFISYKSEKLDEELSMYPNAINTLGGKIKNCKVVRLGSNITEISESSFYECSSLYSFSCNNRLSSIKNYAFYKCESITNFDSLWSQKDYIGNFAFSNCKKLLSATVDLSRSHQGHSIFKDCTSLSKVVLLNEAYVSESMFEGCTNLESVSINNCKTIKENGFKNCEKLKNIKFNKNFSTLESSAFYGCSISSFDLSGTQITSLPSEALCQTAKKITLPKTDLPGKSTDILDENSFKNTTDLSIYIYDTDSHILSNKTSYKSFGSSSHVFYISESGRMYEADENGILSAANGNTAIIVCIRSFDGSPGVNVSDFAYYKCWHQLYYWHKVIDKVYGEGYASSKNVYWFTDCGASDKTQQQILEKQEKNKNKDVSDNLNIYYDIFTNGIKSTTKTNIINALNDVVTRNFSSLIFIFGDHGADGKSGGLVTGGKEGRITPNDFWPIINKIKGPCFMFWGICYGGLIPEADVTIDTTYPRLFICASNDKEQAMSKHIINKKRCRFCANSSVSHQPCYPCVALFEVIGAMEG